MNEWIDVTNNYTLLCASVVAYQSIRNPTFRILVFAIKMHVECSRTQKSHIWLTRRNSIRRRNVWCHKIIVAKNIHNKRIIVVRFGNANAGAPNKLVVYNLLGAIARIAIALFRFWTAQWWWITYFWLNICWTIVNLNYIDDIVIANGFVYILYNIYFFLVYLEDQW